MKQCVVGVLERWDDTREVLAFYAPWWKNPMGDDDDDDDDDDGKEQHAHGTGTGAEAGTGAGAGSKGKNNPAKEPKGIGKGKRQRFSPGRANWFSPDAERVARRQNALEKMAYDAGVSMFERQLAHARRLQLHQQLQQRHEPTQARGTLDH
jgi:hypothetical protein